MVGLFLVLSEIGIIIIKVFLHAALLRDYLGGNPGFCSYFSEKSVSHAHDS
jgi:hypothetical protein